MRVIKSTKELTLSEIRQIKDRSTQDKVIEDFITFLKEDELNKKCLVTAAQMKHDKEVNPELKDWDFSHINSNGLFKAMCRRKYDTILVGNSILFSDHEAGYATVSYSKLKKAIRNCIKTNLEVDLDSLRELFGTLDIAMQTEDPITLDYIKSHLRGLLEETS